MLSNFIRQSWLVLVSSLVFGLLVAFVNGQLTEKIANNAKAKLQDNLQLLLSDAQSFDTAEGTDDTPTYFVGKDATGAIAGYAFEATGGGFADKITLLIAVDKNAEKLMGIAVLKTNETPGFGDKMKDEPFKGQFRNCPVQEKLTVLKTGDSSKVDSEIVAITGATITSEAVVKIVNDAVLQMRPLLLAK